MTSALLDPYGEWYFGIGKNHDLIASKYSKNIPEDFSFVALITTFFGSLEINLSDQKNPGTFQFLAENSSQSGVLFGLLSTAQFQSLLSPVSAAETKSSRSSAFNDFLENRFVLGPDTEFSPFLALPIPLRSDVIFDEEIENPAYEPPFDIDEPTVTIVIDDGINFAHSRFQLPEGKSRVDFAWVMDAPSQTLSTVQFGREWTRSEIEDAISIAGKDPESLLRAIGYLDYARDDFHSGAQSVSHGTHVADLAAGMDQANADPNRRIITVSLPSIATEDPSGITLGVFVMTALSYGLSRARLILEKLGKPEGRIAVNLSYAVSGGPHDGNGFYERVIEEILKDHKSRGEETHWKDTHVVVPAGNTFQSRTHAMFEGGGDLKVDLPWRLPPGDGNSSFLEIWYPKTASAEEIRIESPTGQIWSYPVEPGDTELNDVNGQPFGRLSWDVPIEVFPSERKRMMLALCPTDSTLSGLPGVPHGIWKVSLKVSGSGDKVVDAWIQRDTAPFGYRPLGVQSYFDDPAYQRFQDIDGDWQEADNGSPVRREGTISGIGTAESVWTVGAYRFDPRTNSKVMSEYSSGSASHMRNPDFAYQADTSRALPGILAASSRGNAAVLSGTSVAAPQLTRRIIEQGPNSSNRAHYRYGEERMNVPDALKRQIVRQGPKTG